MIKVTTYDDHMEMTMNGEASELCMDMEYILKGFIDKFLKEAQSFSDDEVIDLMHDMISYAAYGREKKEEKPQEEFVQKLGELIEEYKGKVN